MNDTYGRKCYGFSALYDRATSSWKTSAGTLPWGSTEFSETLPRAGMTRSGKLFPLPALARPTSRERLFVLAYPDRERLEGCDDGRGREGVGLRRGARTCRRPCS